MSSQDIPTDETIAQRASDHPSRPTGDRLAETGEHEQPEPTRLEQADWLEDEPIESELPPRPRGRLRSSTSLALFGVLLVACGFIGGVLVEKGQGSSSPAGGAGALASRFAALRSTAAGGTSGAQRPVGVGSPFAAGGGGATIGQVAYVSGHTLYVTDAEGATVKVTTTAGSTVTKTVKSSVHGIHPGETVFVTGSPGSRGAITAESIRVGEAGTAGGIGALFAGGGGFAPGSGGNGSGTAGNTGTGGNSSGTGNTGTGGNGGTGAGRSGASEEPALFGK